MNISRLLLIILLITISITAGFTQDSDVNQVKDETKIIIQDVDPPEPDITENISVFSGWDLLRMILIFVFVIAFIYGIYFILKKTKGQKYQNNNLIKLLSSRSLSANKSIHLVEVGKKIFLIGAGESEVQLISEIDDKESADEIKLKASSENTVIKKSFKDIFGGFFRKETSDPDADKYIDKSKDFIQMQRNRLKNM